MEENNDIQDASTGKKEDLSLGVKVFRWLSGSIRFPRGGFSNRPPPSICNASAYSTAQSLPSVSTWYYFTFFFFLFQFNFL